MFILPTERVYEILCSSEAPLSNGAESASKVGTDEKIALANKIATLVIGPILVTFENAKASIIRELTFSDIAVFGKP